MIGKILKDWDMKKIWIVLFTAAIFVACTPENRVYKDRQDLSPNIEWVKDDVKTFEFEIKDKKPSHTLTLELRFISGYPFNDAKVKAKFIAPSGESKVKNYQITIKDENGEYLGNPGLDLWDIAQVVDEDLNFKEEGKYKVEFTHSMPIDPYPYVMDLGVIIDQNK